MVAKRKVKPIARADMPKDSPNASAAQKRANPMK